MIAPTINPAFAESDIVASLCRESFYFFVQEFWSTVISEKPVWNWHIKYLCDELQFVAERVFLNQPKLYDLIINIPPGTTKSTIASVMFAPWTWTRMPSAKHINASHADTLVKELSRKSRDIVQSEKYQKCFPNIRIREDQNTKGFYSNTMNGYRLCATVSGQSPVGFHAHFFGVDDPIDPQAAKSETEADIKVANDFMTETVPSRRVDTAITVTVLIMQRLHQNDPSGMLLGRQKKGMVPIKHICLPAELESNISPPELAEFYVDGLLEPVRLTRKALAEFRSKGEFSYSGQYRQDPVPLGGGMFKTARLVYDTPPLKFKKLVRYWDKAATHRGGAFTVGVKMGLDFQDRFWVLDVVRGQWASNEREAIIMHTAKTDGKGVIVGIEQEPGSGGKESAEATVRRLRGYRVRVDKPTGDKEDRWDPYSVQVNAGNVSLPHPEKVFWVREYVEELRFGSSSHYKDQLDASAGAFTLCAKPVIKAGAMW